MKKGRWCVDNPQQSCDFSFLILEHRKVQEALHRCHYDFSLESLYLLCQDLRKPQPDLAILEVSEEIFVSNGEREPLISFMLFEFDVFFFLVVHKVFPEFGT